MFCRDNANRHIGEEIARDRTMPQRIERYLIELLPSAAMTLQLPHASLRRYPRRTPGATRTVYGFFRSSSLSRAVRVSS